LSSVERRGVDEDRRDLVVRHDVALLAGKGGELNLAVRSDPGLLGEVEVVEITFGQEALAVVAERVTAPRTRRRRDEKRREQEDGRAMATRVTFGSPDERCPERSGGGAAAGKAGLHGAVT